MGCELDIRVVDPDEPLALAVLAGYWRDIVGRFYGREATDEDVEKAFIDFPSGHLRPPTGVLLLASSGERPVGCAGLRWSDDREAELTRVWIDPRVRRRGVARRLLAQAEATAREQSCRAVWLEVRRDLVEAQALYRAIGYEQTTPFSQEGRLHEAVFRKELKCVSSRDSPRPGDGPAPRDSRHPLSESTRRLLSEVDVRARARRATYRARVVQVLERHRLDVQDVDPLMRLPDDRAAITINFHPDRRLADGSTVASGLLNAGRYASQFETGISNGLLGGERRSWEEGLFPGSGVERPVEERPKYGGLDVMGHSNGACPRFGSCHLRLRPTVAARTTLTFGDSNSRPDDVGSFEQFAPVLAPLLESADAQGSTLGRPNVDVRRIVNWLRGDDSGLRSELSHALDDYVEAQIHGPLDLAEVDSVVIDPSFAGTPEEQQLVDAALRYRFTVAWHPGTRLALDDVPLDAPAGAQLRWQAMCADGRARELACRVVSEYGDSSTLDARTIGQACRTVTDDPDARRAWGHEADVLVHLKDLWLMLVALGSDGA